MSKADIKRHKSPMAYQPMNPGVLTPSWHHLGSILEGLGLDFGRFWARFCKFLATIWAYDSSWKTCSFDPFCWRLVLDGLVGLREAQRISALCAVWARYECLALAAHSAAYEGLP